MGDRAGRVFDLVTAHHARHHDHSAGCGGCHCGSVALGDRAARCALKEKARPWEMGGRGEVCLNDAGRSMPGTAIVAPDVAGCHSGFDAPIDWPVRGLMKGSPARAWGTSGAKFQ
jgi:hypothetical protein